jgi:hypothetical protein
VISHYDSTSARKVKTAKGAVSEKSGSRSGENGFAGLLDGQLRADDTD